MHANPKFMASETDLSKIVRVIHWLDGYHGYDFKDSVKIDEAVKTTNLEPLKKSWKSVREDVEKIYIQQKHLSNPLRTFKKIREILVLTFFRTNRVDDI